MEFIIGLLFVIGVILGLRELSLWWSGNKRIESAIKDQTRQMKRQKTILCTACGKRGAQGDSFCRHCGKEMP